MPRLEDDFYKPPESRRLFRFFPLGAEYFARCGGRGLRLLTLSPEGETAEIRPQTESNGHDGGPAMLLEFQKRGYYLTYLSECPVTTEHSASLQTTLEEATKVNFSG